MNDTFPDATDENFFYKLDFDQDGVTDAEIITSYHTKNWGDTYLMRMRIVNDIWAIVTADKSEYVCEDTIQRGPGWESYHRYDCNSPDSAKETYISPNAKLFQTLNSINVELETTSKDELWIMYLDSNPFASGPFTSTYDITQGIFKYGVEAGYFIFIKDGGARYAVKVEMPLSNEFILRRPFYVHEIIDIDCL
ncbi:MAG: hypothetical protein AAGI38_21980 [Bacteroidota bacterium]